MKTITITLTLFILTSLFYLNAQQNPELTARHELKFNFCSAIITAFPEVSYEYILTQSLSVGSALGFGFNTDDLDEFSFRVTPFARWFFGNSFLSMNQPAKGMFLEGSFALGTRDNYSYNTIACNNWVDRKIEKVREPKFSAGLALHWGLNL